MKSLFMTLITASLFAGCAQLPASDSATAPRNGPTNEAAINALYETIDSSIRGYEAGLEAAAKGRWDSALALIDEAVESLAVAGSECAETRGRYHALALLRWKPEGDRRGRLRT